MTKIRTAILLSVVLIGCGISATDKENIEASIAIHNSRVGQEYVKDSLDADTKFQIENIRIKDDPQFQLLLIRNGLSFKNNWNRPYTIEKDYELTYEKYLEFCDKNNKDEKTFHKSL